MSEWSSVDQWSLLLIGLLINKARSPDQLQDTCTLFKGTTLQCSISWTLHSAKAQNRPWWYSEAITSVQWHSALQSISVAQYSTGTTVLVLALVKHWYNCTALYCTGTTVQLYQYSSYSGAGSEVRQYCTEWICSRCSHFLTILTLPIYPSMMTMTMFWCVDFFILSFLLLWGWCS